MQTEETKNTNQNIFKQNLLIGKIIFMLDENNIDSSVESIMNFFDPVYPISFNFVISHFLYSSFIAQMKDFNIYICFMKGINAKEKELTNDKYKLTSTFLQYISDMKTQESNYFIEKLFEEEKIDPKFLKIRQPLYFAHHITGEIGTIENSFYDEFNENIENLKKNDWELHKKLIEEGHSPKEIAKIIRYDKIEKLQEISSQTNFDYNQTIKPSLYERCSYINQENITLIDYAAFLDHLNVLSIYL